MLKTNPINQINLKNTNQMETTSSKFTKKPSSKQSNYIIILLSVLGGFTIGYYYNLLHNLKSNGSNPTVTEIKKENINIAVDESNNLLVIDKKTGSYIIYEDSVGMSIFNLYVNNIYNKHENGKTNQ